MNLRNVTFVVAAVVGLTATIAAQHATPGLGTAPAKAKAASVTITGCVAQGIDADHYVLANAVRREDPPGAAAVAGTSRTTRSDKVGANDRTGPYDLQGGEFKAHLGHSVEVTGTSVAAPKPAAAKTTAGPDEREPLPKFNVVSVKMISATCS